MNPNTSLSEVRYVEDADIILADLSQLLFLSLPQISKGINRKMRDKIEDLNRDDLVAV